MFHGVIDVDGHLSYCNGGQEPPLVLARNNGMSWLEAGGPVLGLLPGATYEFDNVTLEAGDLVVICSDGVTEARNAAGEEFGRERLIEAMTGCHGAKPDAVLERLFGAVRTFSQGTPQGDDITGLVLRYRGHPH
jgi:sigma-B regulation protein RsbU (phosphoserine phosphatase)